MMRARSTLDWSRSNNIFVQILFSIYGSKNTSAPM